MSPTVYLAARYERRAEMRRYAAELRERGFYVDADWLAGDDLDERTMSERDLAWCAEQDLDDIGACDIFVFFAETADVGYTRGGRMVELGYAIARAEWLDSPRAIYIVGGAENIFMLLTPEHSDERSIVRVGSWSELLDVLDVEWDAYLP